MIVKLNNPKIMCRGFYVSTSMPFDPDDWKPFAEGSVFTVINTNTELRHNHMFNLLAGDGCVYSEKPQHFTVIDE